MSRIIDDFELSQELVTNIAQQEEQEDLRHHEQMKGVQNTFQNQVNAVCSTIEEMGNPFADQTGDLFVLDTRDIADSKVVETVRTLEQLGSLLPKGCRREQHHCLIQSRKTICHYSAVLPLV